MWDLFSAQHGVATVRQLLESGLSRKRVETLVKQGILRPECYGIVSVAGAPRTARFEMMFGVLVSGARSPRSPISSAIWGPTAAMEHDLVEPTQCDVHVLTTRRPNARPNYIFRQTSRLPASEIVVIDSIPFTDPVRTLIDMADLERHRALAIYRRGLRKGKFTESEVDDRVWTESRQGRGGLVAVRRAISSTDPTAARAKSQIEDRIFDQVVAFGYPPPERNVKVPGSYGFDWEIDLYYPKLRKGIEVSPSGTHGVENHNKDRRKELDLKVNGIDIVTVTEETRGDELRSALRALLGPRTPFLPHELPL